MLRHTMLWTSLLLACTACSKQAPPPERAAPEVTTLTVRTEPLNMQTELPGRVTAQASAEVRPQVGGIIRERLFTEGAVVRQGQTLYQIDPAPFRAALERAEASLASARAAARVSELLVQRYRSLLPEKTISQQDYDNADAAYAQALATVREREAAASAARIDLQWTRVTAPVSGRTGRSLVTPGALVSASQAAPLTTVSQLDPVYVDFTQSSADLLRLRREAQQGHLDRSGDTVGNVELVLEDGTHYSQKGRLRLAEVTVDVTTGAVALRAEFPNPDGVLLPGMYVKAVITEGVNPQAILIPQHALERDRQGRSFVRLVDGEGKIALRDVTVSRAFGARWLIEQGLAPGETIIVEGGQNTTPGDGVRIASSET
ncbi:MAG: efflux RND transporter periplasmic adaptor subunit [Steroidobacteraceae bacterium]